MNASRRHFLRVLRAAAALPAATLTLPLAGLGALAAHQARASGSGDYRALVCLFMAGGNDGHNWVVPTAPAEHAAYAAARGALALPAGDLLDLGNGGQATGRRFGLAAPLAPLLPWYESGHAAVLANVGPLERPLTLADYRAGTGVPRKLFSHNDQQSTWQALAPEGAPSGWGGRMGDLLMALNDEPVFTAVSAAGNAVFLTGRDVVQYQVGSAGPAAVKMLDSAWTGNSGTVQGVMRRRLQGRPADALGDAYGQVLQRAVRANARLAGALAGVPAPALPPLRLPATSGSVTLDQLGLAQQLRTVAHAIASAPALGLRRQVFLVQMGGFDTHAQQMRDHPALSAQVAASIDWFMTTLNTAGLLPGVTLFTASDFGRTLTANGDGSDHGWGSHHIVAGGGTLGTRIHGQFPEVALGTKTDVGSGRLLPTTSVTQLAGALGEWMGLSSGEVADVLPGLSGFDPLTLMS